MIARSRLEALDVPDAHKIDKLPCLFLPRDFDFDFILLSFVSYLGPGPGPRRHYLPLVSLLTLTRSILDHPSSISLPDAF